MSEPKTSTGVVDVQYEGEKPDAQHDKVLANSDLMNDAFDGEIREHEMGAWAAVKTHPWACFWAFIMCFTIVRPSPCCQTLFLGRCD